MVKEAPPLVTNAMVDPIVQSAPLPAAARFLTTPGTPVCVSWNNMYLTIGYVIIAMCTIRQCAACINRKRC